MSQPLDSLDHEEDEESLEREESAEAELQVLTLAVEEELTWLLEDGEDDEFEELVDSVEDELELFEDAVDRVDRELRLTDERELFVDRLRRLNVEDEESEECVEAVTNESVQDDRELPLLPETDERELFVDRLRRLNVEDEESVESVLRSEAEESEDISEDPVPLVRWFLGHQARNHEQGVDAHHHNLEPRLANRRRDLGRYSP